jgi:hypothetical protein
MKHRNDGRPAQGVIPVEAAGEVVEEKAGEAKEAA